MRLGARPYYWLCFGGVCPLSCDRIVYRFNTYLFVHGRQCVSNWKAANEFVSGFENLTAEQNRQIKPCSKSLWICTSANERDGKSVMNKRTNALYKKVFGIDLHVTFSTLYITG